MFYIFLNYLKEPKYFQNIVKYHSLFMMDHINQNILLLVYLKVHGPNWYIHSIIYNGANLSLKRYQIDFTFVNQYIHKNSFKLRYTTVQHYLKWYSNISLKWFS